jgi:acyl-CoA synthetase (AMP-forming)/AMP-acid ligase II
MVDGHMTTGDLGHLDENGRLFVEGRADDMIVSGGENVYPEEVEEALGEHSGVKEAAVIGVDDEEFGERLKAFVVKDGEVSEDDLKSHVKDNLAKYKVPREIEFVDELPRKDQGKVDKKKLEEQEEDDDDSSDSDSDSDDG